MFPIEAVLFAFLVAMAVAIARLRNLFAAAMLLAMSATPHQFSPIWMGVAVSSAMAAWPSPRKLSRPPAPLPPPASTCSAPGP